MQLVIKSLSKTYSNGVRALDNVSLTLTNGMFGLLGPNGAGKSSLMRTIATLQEADSGSVFLDDLDVLRNKVHVRQLLGYLPQEFGVYPRISAEQMLDHIARLKGVLQAGERKDLVQELLSKVNLFNDRKKKLGTFSGGMKQRFGIAQALIGNPKLIIVDEPTAGLDPAERNRFLNLLSGIGRNVVVILSTHIVEDVRELCSRMAIISQGQLLQEGEPRQALNALKGCVWKKVVATDAEREALEKSFHVISTHLLGGLHEVRVYSVSSPGDGFEPADSDLEDVYFFNLTKAERN